MHFCIQCGTQLDPEAQFCPNCGQKIVSFVPESYPASGSVPTRPFDATAPIPSQTPSHPQAPSYPASPYFAQNSPNAEQVLSVIYPARKLKSLGRSDTYSIVLTNYNMILAQVTKELLDRAIEDARANAKTQGKGFFGQWADQIKGDMAYGQKYLSMQPAQIIAETPGNFMISNNAIAELKLKAPFREAYGSSSSMNEFDLEIHSTTTRIDLRIPENNDYVKALKQVFGDRVKTPFGYLAGAHVKIGL